MDLLVAGRLLRQQNPGEKKKIWVNNMLGTHFRGQYITFKIYISTPKHKNNFFVVRNTIFSSKYATHIFWPMRMYVVKKEFWHILTRKLK